MIKTAIKNGWRAVTGWFSAMQDLSYSKAANEVGYLPTPNGIGGTWKTFSVVPAPSKVLSFGGWEHNVLLNIICPPFDTLTISSVLKSSVLLIYPVWTSVANSVTFSVNLSANTYIIPNRHAAIAHFDADGNIIDFTAFPLASAPVVTYSGAISAASATISGAISAASATISGGLSAASATISGAISAASLTVPLITGLSEIKQSPSSNPLLYVGGINFKTDIAKRKHHLNFQNGSVSITTGTPFSLISDYYGSPAFPLDGNAGEVMLAVQRILLKLYVFSSSAVSSDFTFKLTIKYFNLDGTLFQNGDHDENSRDVTLTNHGATKLFDFGISDLYGWTGTIQVFDLARTPAMGIPAFMSMRVTDPNQNADKMNGFMEWFSYDVYSAT